MQLGGQAALTYTIENYPGFPEGVGGAQLGELFQKQAEHFGAVTEFDHGEFGGSVDASVQGETGQRRISGGCPDRRHGRQPEPPGRSPAKWN
jgi:thioredoxin reductase